MLLAIDPGNIESAYCLINKETYEPIEFGKIENSEMFYIMINEHYSELAIEMIASYGMAVGKEVFDTCVWIGRFIEMQQQPFELVYRKDVKLNLCNSTKAKDSNVRQALIDRFAKHDLKNGKGTKNNKDWFYGFKADIWTAYAVGITYLDMLKE